MKLTSSEWLKPKSNEGREYNVFFNNCQRFCRKLASAICKHSGSARTKCLLFFSSSFIPTDAIVLVLGNCANLVLTLAHMADYQGGKLVLRKDAHTLSKGAKLFSCMAFETLWPHAAQRQMEAKYVLKRGSTSCFVFDQKTKVRQMLEIYIFGTLGLKAYEVHDSLVQELRDSKEGAYPSLLKGFDMANKGAHLILLPFCGGYYRDNDLGVTAQKVLDKMRSF